MEVKVDVKFVENDKFKVVNHISGTNSYVDSKEVATIPAGPNPLELFLSSLGACLAIYAKKYFINHSIAFNKCNVEVKANFSQSPPRRLVDIKLGVHSDAKLGDRKDVFLRFIRACPIHNTIVNANKEEIAIDIDFA